jgi:hypothetical protein
MKKPAAFRATFSDLKVIKTRQVVQLCFELPLADFDAAYEVLGGLPNSAEERWFAIAAIGNSSEIAPLQIESKRDWRDLPPQQQAAMRCNEAAFVHFLREQRPDDWAETQDTADCVRLICGVESRAELATNHAARVAWHQLDSQYIAWKLLEHA